MPRFRRSATAFEQAGGAGGERQPMNRNFVMGADTHVQFSTAVSHEIGGARPRLGNQNVFQVPSRDQFLPECEGVEWMEIERPEFCRDNVASNIQPLAWVQDGREMLPGADDRFPWSRQWPQMPRHADT
jgi:hypothetical protein